MSKYLFISISKLRNVKYPAEFLIIQILNVFQIALTLFSVDIASAKCELFTPISFCFIFRLPDLYYQLREFSFKKQNQI